MDAAPETIEILRELPQGTEPCAAGLYWEAFAPKLGHALGPRERGVAFIAAHLHGDRAVVAVLAGRIVALAGFRHAGRALVGGGARDVLHAYGWVGGLRSLALLAVLERRPAPGQLLMDGIVVDPAFRGQGIGTRLLDEVLAVAAEHGYDEVRLDVVDVNPRARSLYERHGFIAVGTQRTPYLRHVLGFGAVTTMHRPARTDAR